MKKSLEMTNAPLDRGPRQGADLHLSAAEGNTLGGAPLRGSEGGAEVRASPMSEECVLCRTSFASLRWFESPRSEEGTASRFGLGVNLL